MNGFKPRARAQPGQTARCRKEQELGRIPVWGVCGGNNKIVHLLLTNTHTQTHTHTHIHTHIHTHTHSRTKHKTQHTLIPCREQQAASEQNPSESAECRRPRDCTWPCRGSWKCDEVQQKKKIKMKRIRGRWKGRKNHAQKRKKWDRRKKKQTHKALERKKKKARNEKFHRHLPFPKTIPNPKKTWYFIFSYFSIHTPPIVLRKLHHQPVVLELQVLFAPTKKKKKIRFEK